MQHMTLHITCETLLNVVKNGSKKFCQKKKKFLPKKGHYPKMGTNWTQIGLLCFAVGDIIKSCAQSKFEAQRLKIALFRTDCTFWDPKLPHLLKKKEVICTLPHFRNHYATKNCQISNLLKRMYHSYETS